MSDYSYLTGKGEPSLPELGTEMLASFVPGLNVAQALRDYKKAAEEKDYVGMGMGAAGVLPAAKAMLMLPAILRRKGDVAARLLNKQLIPTHSTFQKTFKTPEGKLPENLQSPSLLVTDRAGLVPFGNELDEAGQYMDPDWVRDLAFVQKPGALDPKSNVGTIFKSDAGTLGSRGISTSLAERMKDKYADMAFWTHTDSPASFYQPKFKSFEDFLRSKIMQKEGSPGAELKLYGNVPLYPNNFAGALLDHKNPNEELLRQLRGRKLPAQLVDFSSPEAMWDVANWLQQKSIK